MSRNQRTPVRRDPLRAMLLATASAGCACAASHGSGLLSYGPNDDMTITGSLSGSATAHLLGCGADSDTPPPETPSPNPLIYSLNPGGGFGQWLDGFQAHATACAEGEVDYNSNLQANANRGSLNVSFIGMGPVQGEVIASGDPCDPPGGSPLGGFTAALNASGSVYIEFTVTQICFMDLDAEVFYLGDVDGYATADWDISVVCGDFLPSQGTVTASSADPLDVDGRLCCVYPGDYTLSVDLTVTHAAGGVANCANLSVSDGGVASVGFTLNVNFQDFCTCEADLNNDGVVDVSDMMIVINNWGTCASFPCAGDLNHDGVVDTTDLMAVINAWGECECCL